MAADRRSAGAHSWSCVVASASSTGHGRAVATSDGIAPGQEAPTSATDSTAARFADLAEQRAMLSQDLRTAAHDNGIDCGEDRTIAEFDRVLSYDDVPPELEPTVGRQAAEIRSARNEVAALVE